MIQRNDISHRQRNQLLSAMSGAVQLQTFAWPWNRCRCASLCVRVQQQQPPTTRAVERCEWSGAGAELSVLVRGASVCERKRIKASVAVASDLHAFAGSSVDEFGGWVGGVFRSGVRNVRFPNPTPLVRRIYYLEHTYTHKREHSLSRRGGESTMDS